MVEGVTNGIKDLGDRRYGIPCTKARGKAGLNLGFSHPVEMEDPEGIEVEVPDPNKIIVKGIDKQLVGNYTAIIRAWRQPEPYKGRGQVRR